MTPRRPPPSERLWGPPVRPSATDADVFAMLARGPASEGALAAAGGWGVTSVLAALGRLKKAGRVRLTGGPAPKWEAT